MKTQIVRRMIMGSIAAGLMVGLPVHAQKKEVTIAHQDMLVPWHQAIVRGEVEKATGYKVNYKMFGGGGDVIRAMASGQVQIGEAGSAPIASGISQGLPVELIWILDDIASAEALVVRDGSGVKTLADLKGKRIGVPFTSTTHFHTLVALESAGVNPNSVKILNMRPPDIAAAWKRGDIDATFIWNPVLSEVQSNGKVLITSGKISKDTGKATFDGIVVNKEWAKDHKDFLVKFIKVVADADERYRKAKANFDANHAMAKDVAKLSGAKPEIVPTTMALMGFPTAKEQASPTWLGGGKDGAAAKSLAATAAFLKSQGTIAATLPDYSVAVNPSYAQAVAK